MLRENTSKLKVIQLGLTLANSDGIFPSPTNTWQFNFLFNKKTDKYNKVSIDLLTKAGIDFDKLSKQGIPHNLFRDTVLNNGGLF
jgi:CCR4-NOT transcription complex subunit 7/8